VTTDAVLLGAWVDATKAAHILDIGTGSGVLALMMAQKYSDAMIDAIDIDAASVEEAKFNFSQSPWSARLSATCQDFKSFETEKKYDLIITNPPYFIDSLPSTSMQKATAKHDGALTYEQLINGITKLITEDGEAFLILPFVNFDRLAQIADSHNLYIKNTLEVCSFQFKKPYVVLVSLRKQISKTESEKLVIRNSDLSYTAAYQNLTAEFYL